MKNKSLKKNAALNMVKTIMGLIFPLITFPYASRILQPSGLGKVNFAHSIISYFSMIAALGINTYAVREAAKLREDKAALTKFVKEILTINMTSTVIAYLLLSFTILFVPYFSEYRVLLVVCSGTILFTTLGMDWLYTALEEFSYITIRSILFQFLSLILLFVFVHTQEDYLKYASISVISSVGSNICNFIHARKYISITEKIKKTLCHHLKPIFTLFAMSVAVSIYTALDTTMLGFIAGDEQVGFYTAATKINKIVLAVITAASAVLLPRLSYYISQHENEQFFNLSAKALNLIILLSLPCAVGLSLVARPVVLLLSGVSYESAIPVMQIMNPIIVAISLSGLIGIQIFMPLGKEKLTLVSVILGAVINFTLNLILIPKHGALGAGVATICAESSVTLFQLILVRKYFEWKRIVPHVIQCIFACIIMTLCILFLEKIQMNMILQLVLTVIIGAFVYGTVLIVFHNKFILSIIKGTLKR